MDIIHLNSISHGIIEKWSSENKQLQIAVSRYQPFYFKHCAIEFEDENDLITTHYTVKNQKVKWNCKNDGRQIISGNIISTPDGENDFQIRYKISDNFNGSLNLAQHIVKVICNDYIVINNIFLYGNIVDSNTKIQGKSEEKDKHYFIQEFDGELYAINSHNHRSPEGVFSVRGHFRKYKSGKIIWIDEYLKGVNK